MRDQPSPRTRILYVQPSDHFGGAERQAATLLPRLVKQGVDVTALVGPGRTILDWLKTAGVSDIVHSDNFPADWAEARGFERLGRAREFVARAGRLGRQVGELLDAGQFDAVVAGMAISWVAATPPSRARGVPILWRAGGTELSAVQRVVLQLWAHRNPPDALVCNSEAVRQMFAPLVPARASLVRNGVDNQLFRVGAGNPANVGLGRERAQPVVGFAGRLVPQKRPQDFLAMAAVVARRHPGVRFLMAGEGSRRPMVERQAAELGLGDRLRFLGLVPDMRDFYAACDLLVLPSRSEGCPNTVLEAMAMKVAVVASDTPATREVVQSLSDGLLYPTGDVDRLVLSVERLLSDSALRAELAERAWRKVQGPFSADASALSLIRRIEATVAGVRTAAAPGERRPSPTVLSDTAPA
jgi:glycosyltransferase involved in cell wall biosynthesis